MNTSFILYKNGRAVQEQDCDYHHTYLDDTNG
jgi:hypothetical protein